MKVSLFFFALLGITTAFTPGVQAKNDGLTMEMNPCEIATTWFYAGSQGIIRTNIVPEEARRIIVTATELGKDKILHSTYWAVCIPGVRVSGENHIGVGSGLMRKGVFQVSTTLKGVDGLLHGTSIECSRLDIECMKAVNKDLPGVIEFLP